MRIAAPILAGSLLLATAVAQDPVDQKPAKPTPAARLQELQDAQQKLVADWRKAIDAAREAAKEAKPGAAIPAMPMRPDFGPLCGKAKDHANEFAGTEDAVPFLVFVVQNATDKAMRREALETLLDKHLDSPKLGEIAGIAPFLARIVDAEFAASAVDRLAKSANANVRGWALFARHKDDIENAATDGEQYGFAKKALQKAAEEAGDERLADEIRSTIALREKFGIGSTAPDIEGLDLDGVAFKLSDYKGKVIFLDFWGDW